MNTTLEHLWYRAHALPYDEKALYELFYLLMGDPYLSGARALYGIST